MAQSKYTNYSLDDYKADINKHGLKTTWEQIIKFRRSHNDDTVVEILRTGNFGELYEIGLAYVNKISKKEMGKYFTPDDVALCMAEYFDTLEGECVCDVCCGVGNLILGYFSYIGRERSRELLLSNKIYLYDIDETALYICKNSIAMIYGEDCYSHIHSRVGDFLDRRIKLPSSCKVISNPPYYRIQEFGERWEVTNIVKDSRELYSAFMEKIIKHSCACVLITPFSFIGGSKFYSLRYLLNKYNGSIYSFDNIPAHIFNGRKHGVFNSNNTNAVRAAITIVENKANTNGFKVSPLIRFQSSERDRLLNKDNLERLLPERRLVVSENARKYPKCFKSLQGIYDAWTNLSDGKFEDLVSKEKTKFMLSIPTTCRYYLSATKRNLKRDGKVILYFKDEKSYYYAYCILNSSFAYWYWRLFDGGITYPLSLLLSMPIKTKSINDASLNYLKAVVVKMQKIEKRHLVYKKNASNIQENVKFPERYRVYFNEFILNTLGLKEKSSIFDVIHSNCIFGGK